MEKGQHLRLLLNIENSGEAVIALATDMTFHLSAQVENSTTKDDGNGANLNEMWDNNEVVGLSGEIQVNALVGVGEDSDANKLHEVMIDSTNSSVVWELDVVSGSQNRTVVSKIATGSGFISNVNPVGQNGQNATYSCTVTISEFSVAQ